MFRDPGFPREWVRIVERKLLGRRRSPRRLA